LRFEKKSPNVLFHGNLGARQATFQPIKKLRDPAFAWRPMAANHLLAAPAFALPLGSDDGDDDTRDGRAESTGIYSFGQVRKHVC
jgi:hypothetical protein